MNNYSWCVLLNWYVNCVVGGLMGAIKGSWGDKDDLWWFMWAQCMLNSEISCVAHQPFDKMLERRILLCLRIYARHFEVEQSLVCLYDGICERCAIMYVHIYDFDSWKIFSKTLWSWNFKVKSMSVYVTYANTKFLSL